MDAPVHDPREESIGELVGRLVEDGRAYARAEVDLYKRIARYRAAKARNGAVALAAGGVLLWFSFTAFVLGAVMALAVLIGPLAAGAAVAAVLALTGYVLVRFGLSRLGALSGDEEERAALKRGEEAK